MRALGSALLALDHPACRGTRKQPTLVDDGEERRARGCQHARGVRRSRRAPAGRLARTSHGPIAAPPSQQRRTGAAPRSPRKLIEARERRRLARLTSESRVRASDDRSMSCTRHLVSRPYAAMPGPSFCHDATSSNRIRSPRFRPAPEIPRDRNRSRTIVLQAIMPSRLEEASRREACRAVTTLTAASTEPPRTGSPSCPRIEQDTAACGTSAARRWPIGNGPPGGDPRQRTAERPWIVS